MTHRWRLVAWIAAAWFIGFAAVIAFVVLFDWDRTRPWVNKTISAAIDRPFAINGKLNVDWVRSTAGLRWFIPRPLITATDITIGNVEWAQAKDFGTIERIAMVIDPPPLLHKIVVLPLLDIECANLSLQRRTDSNNWTFGKQDETESDGSGWRFAPGLLRIHRSAIQLEDEPRHLSAKIDADSNEKGVVWKLTGKLNNAPLQAHGSAGSVLALQDKTTPYPIAAHVRLGETKIDAVGTLTNPSQLAALDLQLKLSGASMAHLYTLTNITLPETFPYHTEGHLTGTLNAQGGTWRYEKFKGAMGSSDVQGTLVYTGREPRPLLSGSVASKQLNFVDLAPLIGADSNENKERRQAAVRQPEDKVLPVEPFKTDRWGSIDADVKFTAEKILRQEQLPINSLNTHIHLENSVLTLSPLNFGIAGGDLVSTIVLNGNKQPLAAEIDLASRALKLKELFPTVEAMQASAGQVNGSAALTANGNSIAALLGSANGDLKLYVDRGTVSRFILEAAGLNLLNLVLTKLFGDQQVALNCAAANFEVGDGVMKTENFIVDTDTALFDVSGDILLNKEQLALTVKPQSKGVRLVTLRTPLHVQGTFKEPDVNLDKGVLALRGGGAAALGAVAGPAALLALIDAGVGDLEKENGCAALLAQLGGGKQPEPDPKFTVEQK